MHAQRLCSLLLSAIALGAFAGPAYAMKPVPCPEVLRTSRVELRECSPVASQREVSLTFQREGDEPVTMRAEFDLGLSERMFRRFSGKETVLSAADLQALRAEVAGQDLSSLSVPARSLLDFATRFVEPGFRVKGKDLTAQLTASQHSLTAGTTMICERLTKPTRAVFTARGQVWQQTIVVGSDGCMGKCGPGCAPDGLWYQGQYTQQCLNHDACAVFTGDNMGDCSDEFWAAADGFLNGPSCMYPAGPPHLEPPAPYKAPRKKRRHF